MRVPLMLLALVLVGASSARAQECLAELRFPQVGRWAEYKATYNEKEPYTIRYAVIGEEKRAGKNLKWLELKMSGANKDRNFIYQMLVPGSPTEMGEVQEVVFKPGDRPAMKMNGMMMNMIRGQMEKQNFMNKICKDVTLVGQEKVRVPAGSFKARHFHSAKYNSDSWVAADVPFAMVKSIGKDYQMELAAQGSGAKSSITEKPKEMQGMGGPSSR
jgi:hypothetical protein